MSALIRLLRRLFVDPIAQAQRYYGPAGFWTRVAVATVVFLALGAAFALRFGPS